MGPVVEAGPDRTTGPKEASIRLRLSAEEHARWHAAAKSLGLTLSDLIREAVDHYIAVRDEGQLAESHLADLGREVRALVRERFPPG